VELFRVGAEPHAGLALDHFAHVSAQHSLQLVVLAPFEARQGVENRHQLIVVVHSCG
jgi:hypothetical protein